MTRTQRIKEYIRSYPPEICMERGRIYTEEFFSHPERPLVIGVQRLLRGICGR